MSAITFPHGYPAHSPSFVDDDSPGSSYDMLGSASGFQMNPLSAHPPRTPRTSLVASTSMPETRSTRTSLYMEEAVPQESAATIEESEGEEVEVEVASESARTKAVRARVRREDVWREIVKSSNGRDKALKLIQYTLRVYLLFHNALARRTTLGAPRAWQIELLSRLNSTTSGLSLTRKCLLLFNWLSPLTAILAENAASVDGPPVGASGTTIPRGPKPLLHTFLHAPPPVLLELLNAAADDVSTWARLGLLGGKTGERAARLANWCWFASTLVGLVENGVERSVIVGSRRAVEGRMWTDSMSGQTAKSQPKNTKIDESELQKLQTQDYWLQVHRAKLIMDLVFVSCDVFRVKRGKNSVQTFTGLASAVLSSAKLYDRSRGTLLKAVRY